MGLTDSLGRLARDWARSRATELLTADPQTREDAALAAEATARSARDDVGDRAVRAAFAGLDALAERQAERRRVAETEQARVEQAENAALPRARVTARLTGALTWEHDGDLPLRCEPHPAELAVELVPPVTDPVHVGTHELTRLGFVVPGFTGDGHYDLAALYRARAAAGADDLLDWGVELDDSASSAWFHPDAGASTVVVSGGARRLDVVLAMSSSAGAVALTASITR